MPSIYERTLQSLDEWVKICQSVEPTWIFRGQCDAKLPLRTSLERCCDNLNINPVARKTVESGLIREFMRAYHQYATHVPKSEYWLEYLSLMQHYGAPTRLLDFTYSIYIATYFAIESVCGDDNCAVWAINGKWAINEAILNLEEAKIDGARQLKEPITEELEKIFYYMFFEEPLPDSAIPMNPFRLNERLRTQKGVFLVPVNPISTFMENLEALSGYEDARNAIKFISPAKFRIEILKALFDMNISRTSLFPGLDGYAQSLRIYHTSYFPISWDYP